MSRARRNERGQVIVLGAVMIPVFLLMAALVLDVGNWYTHKRQLQNRADAAAFAAGVSYGKNWKACVQNTDPAAQVAAAQRDRQHGTGVCGRPRSGRLRRASPGPCTTREIANQSKLDVVINSTNYTDNTDDSDGGETAWRLCAHAANPAIDSPRRGLDGCQGEGARPSVARSAGIGLPLSRNGARARIEIRPAISGTGSCRSRSRTTSITKVQIRYFDECRDPGHQNPLLVQNLKPLPDADQTAWTAAGGGVLWGVPSSADPNVGSSTTAIPLTLPVYDPSCGDYLPIAVQVRLASRDEIDLDSQCSALVSADFADCFTRISQIRVWNDGNADNFVRVTNVRLTGGCPRQDAYFGRLPSGSTQCTYGVSADINWGTRPDGNKAIVANFTVTANGATLRPDGGAAGINGTWSTTGTPITANPGANAVTMDLSWNDNDNTHTWQGNNCTGNNCKYSANNMPVHQAFVGTRQTAGAVDLVRTSLSSFVAAVPGPGTVPGPAFDNAPGAVQLRIAPHGHAISFQRSRPSRYSRRES